jgi:hypothetical protein
VDGSAGDLELLLAAARKEAGALKQDPLLSEFPGSRGAALREHVLDLLGAVEHRLEEQPAKDAPEPSRRAFARSVRQGVHMLRAAHTALPWLAATRAPNLNLGSLYMAEEFARILVGDDVDLVAVPNQQQYMYSTTSWPFSRVIDNTPSFEAETKRRPIVLNYPLGDSDRLLLHPILAHEFGHPSCQEHELVASAEALLAGNQNFNAALEQVIEEMGGVWTSPPEQIARTIRAHLRSWIEELLCDHLAIEVSGPAFIWAFAMFAMPFSYGEPGLEHPPNTVRLRLASEHLARRGWRPYMERVAPGATAWLDEIAADAEMPLEPLFSFIRDQLLTNPEVLQDTAIGRVGERALDRSACEMEAEEAAVLLEDLILPLGLATPLDGRSILIGGWQRAFSQHADDPAGMVEATADGRLQDLVGKAMEMSVVVKAWEGV